MIRCTVCNQWHGNSKAACPEKSTPLYDVTVTLRGTITEADAFRLGHELGKFAPKLDVVDMELVELNSKARTAPDPDARPLYDEEGNAAGWMMPQRQRCTEKTRRYYQQLVNLKCFDAVPDWFLNDHFGLDKRGDVS
jgi:hypothetical protein